MQYYSASFYFVRYRILGKIIRETYRRFKWKIWLLSVLFITLFFLGQMLHLIFRLCDELFFRGYKKTPVRQPVFIIANPRSGTTLLHRLISMDEERFTYTRFLYTFQMTVSFVRFTAFFRWLDDRSGNVIRKVIDRLDKKIWGGWDDVHEMGFDKAEEDEQVFAQALMSPGIFIPFPYLHLIGDNKFLDLQPEPVRKNMMAFYESSIRRFVFATGKNKTYLAKNVMSTGRIQSLLEQFPDAKFIYIARHPYQALPSFVSMCGRMYSWHSPEITDVDPAKMAWAELGMDFYRYSLKMKTWIPPEQFISLKYDDLIRNPEQEVLKIYSRFGWQPDEAFLSRLRQEREKSQSYKSKHEYSLEKYGLQKESIYASLSDFMNEMGFEK